MDDFLYLFDIQTVSRNWTTFSLNGNNTYTIGYENNFLAFTDNVLNPITNLNNSNVSAFNFPFALELYKNSPTSLATFFFQLVTNTIYTNLPNFRSLK